MNTKRKTTIALMALVAAIACAPACGGVKANVAPPVLVANYGTDVLSAVRLGQETVIGLNKTQPAVMTDARTRAVLDKVILIVPVAERLKAALIAYDAATNLDFRKLQAEEVKKLAAEVAALATAAFRVDVPQPLANGLADLAMNVVNITTAIRIEVEKFK